MTAELVLHEDRLFPRDPDTRAFLSIPARHDVARRVDCAYLAELVCEHRLDEDEALDVAIDLAYHFAKKVYKL